MIQERIQAIQSSLPQGVSLVAVSKFHPAQAILSAYDCGQRIFGESRVQELLEKEAALPKDIKWHMIGHLQTNKVKQIIHFIDLIQSVDSLKLLEEINKQAQRIGRKVKVLLQVHIAQEEHKFGFTTKEVIEVIQNRQQWESVEITGLMAMATFTDDEAQITHEFTGFRKCFDEVLSIHPELADQFTTCCFGMSDDYPIAVSLGSTMVRIGSAIFGNREYN